MKINFQCVRINRVFQPDHLEISKKTFFIASEKNFVRAANDCRFSASSLSLRVCLASSSSLIFNSRNLSSLSTSSLLRRSSLSSSRNLLSSSSLRLRSSFSSSFNLLSSSSFLRRSSPSLRRSSLSSSSLVQISSTLIRTFVFANRDPHQYCLA